MKLSLALFALAAAANVADTGYGQAPEQATEQAPEQATYEQAPEASYEPAAAQEPHYLTPAVDSSEPFHCRAPCPSSSPCLNKETGACATKIEPYGATHADPVCPEGTENSNHLWVRNTWPFWVGFGLLFAPALFFLCVTIGDVIADDLLNNKVNHMPELHTLVAGFILLVASLAYFAMATRNGYIVRCGDGRSFYYARYIDWIITTPLILFELFHLLKSVFKAFFEVIHIILEHVKLFPKIVAGLELLLGKIESIALGHLDFEMNYIIFLDIMMIIAGLIASLLTSHVKWVFFAFSVLAFIPVLRFICKYDIHHLLSKKFKASMQSKAKNDQERHLVDAFFFWSGIYRKLAGLTVIAWFLYPIVWILAEGTGALSATGEAVFYMILDVIAKSGFAVIVYINITSNILSSLKK